MASPIPELERLRPTALGSFSMDGTIYSQASLAAPWGISFPELPGTIMFHLVTEGRCWVRMGEAGEWVEKGELVLLCHGDGHAIQSDRKAETRGIFEIDREIVSESFERIRLEGDGPKSVLTCGVGMVRHPYARRLLDAMPRLVRLNPDRTKSAHALIQFIDTFHPQLAFAESQIVGKLMDVIVLCAMQEWMDSNQSEKSGWLRALADRRLGPVLTAIHNQPEKPWTVDSLAELVDVSRSWLASAFLSATGLPVARYLATYRMDLAGEALLIPSSSIAEVAERAGYQSVPAFGLAFRRHFGVSPGKWRTSERRAAF